MDRHAWKLKGIDLILEAFQLLLDTHSQALLSIVGTHGNGLCHIQNLAQSLGILDRIEFPGRVSNQLMAEHYQRSTIFVCASHYETFGVSVAEALACGLPVVTSALQAIHEVAGDTAVVVKQRDPHAFASAIRTLLDDSSLRRRLGRDGRSRICTHFSIEARTTAIRRILAELDLETACASSAASRERS
jgi:glycosyltransferase involved in cell wall biosynthesis